MPIIGKIERKRRHRDYQRNYVLRRNTKGFYYINIWMKVKKQNILNLRSALQSSTGEEIIHFVNHGKKRQRMKKGKKMYKYLLTSQ